MIIATNNNGKLKEFKKIFNEYEISSLKEKKIDVEVLEDQGGRRSAPRGGSGAESAKNPLRAARRRRGERRTLKTSASPRASNGGRAASARACPPSTEATLYEKRKSAQKIRGRRSD